MTSTALWSVRALPSDWTAHHWYYVLVKGMSSEVQSELLHDSCHIRKSSASPSFPSLDAGRHASLEENLCLESRKT